MTITFQAAADLLARHDDIVILAHRKPDGDTLGSCFGLLYALESLGKRARVACADGYPSRYSIIYGDYQPADFAARFVVACDVASIDLLGGLAAAYPQVDLCIDHHKSNTFFAKQTVLAPAPSAAEVVYRVITAMGVRPDKRIATAIYTGLTTDTGCFRFASVTPATMRLAAELMDCGAPAHRINKRMFDSKTKGRIEVEKQMMQSLEYSHDGMCAMISLPGDIHGRFGVTEDDLDGISAFPRRIEGVLCGITIRAQPDGSFRVSLRCDPPLDASAICAAFGGGGHVGAAGCTLRGTLDDVKERLRAAVGEAISTSDAATSDHRQKEACTL